jgi:CheY-like chemotaxis protein
LIVDDDAGDVLFARRALMADVNPVNLRVAEDGVEATEYLRSMGDAGYLARPDLILLDRSMPRKDGREVLAEITQDADLQSIPVVVFTTSIPMKTHDSLRLHITLTRVSRQNFGRVSIAKRNRSARLFGCCPGFSVAARLHCSLAGGEHVNRLFERVKMLLCE